jgi:ribosome-binding protein aMBF1 (putative translation factor)
MNLERPAFHSLQSISLDHPASASGPLSDSPDPSAASSPVNFNFENVCVRNSVASNNRLTYPEGMNVKLQEVFRKNVLEALTQKGWTKSQLAFRLEMTPQAVSAYVNGHRVPGLDLVEKFASALELSVIELLDEHSSLFLQTTV